MTLAWLASGCDSLRGPHQGVVAPAVEGRVLDAVTREPVAGARVHRVTESTGTTAPAQRHGGEVLQDLPPVSTDAEGSFRLAEIRAGYLLFERTPPLLVSLRIEHRQYRTFTTNLDLLKITPVQTSNRPVVPAGDLYLIPRTRAVEPADVPQRGPPQTDKQSPVQDASSHPRPPFPAPR